MINRLTEQHENNIQDLKSYVSSLNKTQKKKKKKKKVKNKKASK